MVVRVVDGVEKLAGLGKESTDLTVVPSRNDALSVGHEAGAEALEAGNLNTEKLLARGGVPHTDIIERAGGEQLRVPSGERDVVNALIMASVSKFGSNIVSVAPVDSCLVSSGEAVSRVGGKGDGGNSAHNLGLTLDKHVLSCELSNSTISSSNHNVVVVQQLNGVNSLREKTLGRSNSLEKAFVETDLNNITSACSEKGVHIGGVNGDASVVTLDLAHADVLVKNFLGDEINIPETDSVIVDSDKLIVGVVEEFNLVSDVHTNGVTDESFAGLDLKFKSIVTDQLVYCDSCS